MEAINNVIFGITNWVWGLPMLIFLVGGGAFLTVRLKFRTFTKLGFALKQTIGKSMKGEGKAEEGKHSGFQAVTAALASTLGAGNIIGTAMAIGLGGPGGVFWLWVTGIFCMAVKYSEVVMGMKYRHLDAKGEWEGGPQFYLSEATGQKWMSPAYSLFCFLCLILAASAQIGSGVDNLANLGVPRIPSTVVLVVLAGLVVVGGLNSLLKVTEKIVPAMSIIYMVGCLIVIVMNIANLPGAIISIFASAFTGHAAVGGFAGAALSASIRWGVARGCYSNDSGTGVTTITHAVAEANHPAQQGLWGIFEVFFDTIIVCSMTCLAILSTGVWMDGIEPAVMTATAFSKTIGSVGGLIVTISVILFTWTTACAQIEFSAQQVRAFLGDGAAKIVRWIMLAFLIIGGIVGISALIQYVDFFNWVFIAINMIGVYLCNGEIVALTEEYFADPEKWEKTMWPKWVEMKAEFAKNGKSV